MFSRRLQGKASLGASNQTVTIDKLIFSIFMFISPVQERLANEIANAVNEILSPRGVGIVIEAT